MRCGQRATVVCVCVCACAVRLMASASVSRPGQFLRSLPVVETRTVLHSRQKAPLLGEPLGEGMAGIDDI